jgi:hypothetical protein
LPGAKFPAVKNPIDDRRLIWPQSRYRGRQGVLSSDNEVPHIFTRKSRVQPKEILISNAKRLFQQHRSIAELLRHDYKSSEYGKVILHKPARSRLWDVPARGATRCPGHRAACSPLAATTALEMIGPTPGTLMSLWQLSSCLASASISVDTAAMRWSKRRQSWISSPMRLIILGDSASDFELRISGSAFRKGMRPCRTVMPRSSRKPGI